METYDWILFDADNTILDFDSAEAQALKQTLSENGMQWSAEVLDQYRIINKRAWDDYERGVLPKAELPTIRFRQLLDYYDLDYDVVKIASQYRTFLSQSDHVIPGVIDLLDDLKKKYKLALITNGLRDVQRPRIKSTGLDRYFDPIVISDEIGVAKPDAAFFEYVHDKILNVDKKKVLVVGDNPNADIRGALDFGYDACWYQRPGMKHIEGLSPQYHIHSLPALRRLLL